MADDNRIEIVASLDKPKSVSTITNDLQWVADKLNAKHALKITGNLDLPKTTQRIQSQLATINKDLKLDINGVNVNSTVMQTVSAVQNSISKVGTNISVQPQIDSKSIDSVSDALTKFGIGADNVERLTKYLSELDVIITKIAPKIVNIAGKGEILDSVTIQGIDKQTGSIVKIVDQISGKVAKTTYTVTQNLAEIEKENKRVEDSAKAAQIAYNDFLKLKGEADVYAKKYSGDESLKSQIADIQKLTSAFDNTQPIEKQREQIINLSNALKLLKVDIDNIKQSSVSATTGGVLYPDIAKIGASGTDNSAQLERAKNDLNDFFQNIAKVEDSATRIKRAVSDTEGELTRFYVQVEKEDKSVETLTYALNEQGTAYEFLSKAIREADNSTDFRRKGLDVQKEIKTEKVNEFITQLKEANLYTGDLKTRADELKESISKVTDTNSMNKFLDDFDIAKAKFSAMKAESHSYNNSLKDTENYINKAITALEKFNNSAIAKRNSNNADVISQTGANANLVSQLKTLSDSLGADKSTANIQRIKQEIDRLAPSIEKATADSQNLVRALTDNRLSQDAAKRLNNLTNQINTFANANKKAIESTRQMRSGVTFADEWKRITDTLKAGNLDDNAIRQLTADFQNFRGEARSVGNVTNTVFTNMGGQIQMLMSRWLSLYAVIGKIKQMITYVIELDDAMTKLKRVTDETAEGYERFLEVAKKSAKETNTTLVDTVEQAAKWAKSGYDAATSAQLAKTSLIYSIVGDIDNDTAVSDLVTALRGFRLEAEDAMSIVDKLDALNNKYATDAKSLGEALTVSASAMANAGNSLDQTLALITGATEITQNAKETGQAIRTITMRIRGKLYASI